MSQGELRQPIAPQGKAAPAAVEQALRAAQEIAAATLAAAHAEAVRIRAEAERDAQRIRAKARAEAKEFESVVASLEDEIETLGRQVTAIEAQRRLSQGGVHRPMSRPDQLSSSVHQSAARDVSASDPAPIFVEDVSAGRLLDESASPGAVATLVRQERDVDFGAAVVETPLNIRASAIPSREGKSDRPRSLTLDALLPIILLVALLIAVLAWLG